MTTATADVALELTRVFDAAPDRVFDAWLSKIWGEWAGPPGGTGEVVLMEPQVGGRYRLNARTPDGQQLPVSGVYKEIEQPCRIRFTRKWDHDDHETEVTLTFRPRTAAPRSPCAMQVSATQKAATAIRAAGSAPSTS